MKGGGAMKSINQQQARLRGGRGDRNMACRPMLTCVGCGRGRPFNHYRLNGNNFSHRCRKCRKKEV